MFKCRILRRGSKEIIFYNHRNYHKNFIRCQKCRCPNFRDIFERHEETQGRWKQKENYFTFNLTRTFS